MDQVTGRVVIKFYNEHSTKVNQIEDPTDSFLNAKRLAIEWESKHIKNSAVISRILYNTLSKNNKWDCTEDMKLKIKKVEARLKRKKKSKEEKIIAKKKKKWYNIF